MSKEQRFFVSHDGTAGYQSPKANTSISAEEALAATMIEIRDLLISIRDALHFANEQAGQK